MSAPVHRPVLALLALVSAASACAARLEDVVRGQAAGELSCPESQVTVRSRSGGSEVRNYVVSACGRERSYQAACNSLGTCVAYPVSGRDDAAAPGGEDLWADPAPTEPENEADPRSLSTPTAMDPPQPDEAEVATPVVRNEPRGEPRPVTLRNECERTVALFLGEDPATGAGRYTSLGSMNTATQRLRPGELVWLLDAKGEGRVSIAADAGVEEVAVLEGCTGFITR